MRFASPQAFQLMWLLPVILVASVAFERRAKKQIAKALGAKLAPFLSSSVSQSKRRLRLALILLSLSCFITALARPQMGESLQEIKAQGVEMIIAVDVSNSMLAEDVKPSRLAHAKSEAMKLLDLLGGDKVGLVAFAGSAVLISPLTSDKGSLKMFIESLNTTSVENQGTNFFKALKEARGAFERGGVDQDETSKVTRVILILSDGEDQEKDAVTEAKKLADDGTRIFTLAFGTENGAPIPMRDERGFLREYKRDKRGQNVISRVKGDFLQELAQIGHGAFHHATFGGEEAKALKADLDLLQKSEFASSMATNYDERFQFPLFFGVVFALLSMMVSERRAAGRIWKGRFEVAES